MKFMKELLGDSSALTSDNIDIPTLQDVLGEAQPITYVPFRNQLMLSMALSYAEAIKSNKICFGAQAHDEYSGYWDTTMSFVDAINNVAKLNRENQIRIIAPFVKLSKCEEIIIGNELNIPYEDTITCYNGTNCGECPTCKDRIKAFAVAGYKDPLYDLNWEELFQKYEKVFELDEIENKIEGDL